MRKLRLVLFGLVATLSVVFVLLLQEPSNRLDSLDPLRLSEPKSPFGEAPAGRGPARSVAELAEESEEGVLAREEVHPSPTTFNAWTELPSGLLSAEIRVRVEAAAGEALAGATLELEWGVEQLPLDTWSTDGFRLEATSDADGRALFKVPPVGIFSIRATRAGFAAARISPVLPGDEVTLPMSRGRILTGRVVSRETGVPLEGASVRLAVDRLRRFTESDDEGAFQFEDLPDGQVRLDALAEGFDLERVSAVEPDGERVGPALLELSQGADFHGQVVDLSGGRPIAAVEVNLRLRRGFDGDDPVARTVRTNANGEFYFASISRSGLELELRAEGYADAIQTLVVQPEDHEATQEFSLAAEALVAGWVRRTDGSPVEGAEVTLGGRSKEVGEDRTVTSGPDGRFLISAVLPGQQYQLRAVQREEQLAPSESQTIAVPTAEAPAGAQEVEIILRAGARLRGVVQDALGQPAPYAQVILEDLPTATWRVLNRSPVVFADVLGEFQFEGLPDALVHISARSGEAVSEQLEIGLTSGSEQATVLVLQQGLSLSGLVVDGEGVPVEEAWVSVFSTVRDFSLPELPQSPESPKARKSKSRQPAPDQPKARQKRLSKEAQVAEKRRKAAEQKRKQQIAKLLERDRNGGLFRSAIGGGRGGSTAFRGLARTDSSGAFRLSGLLGDQQYVLVVRKEGFEPVRQYQLVPDELAGGRALQRKIVLARLLSLTGMVVNSGTRLPLERFQVSARPVGEATPDDADLAALLLRRQEQSRGFRSTDGSFELTGLRPGAYEVSVRARGFHSPQPKRVELPGVLGAGGLYALTPASQVAGNVRKGNGTELFGVPVFLIPESPPSTGPENSSKKSGKRGRRQRLQVFRRTTNQQGEFLFNDVPPGHYQIGLGQPGAPLAGPLQLFVEDGGLVQRDFRYDAVGALLVEVRADGGFGLRKARVRLKSRPAGTSYSLSTDEKGRVEFSNVLADEYVLSISARGYQATSSVLKIQAGDRNTKVLSLEPRN